METVLEFKNRAEAGGGLGDLPTFVGLPSRESSRALPEETARIFKGILSVTNDLLLEAVDAQTAEEFEERRTRVFDDIRQMQRSLSDLAKVIIPKPTLDRLVWQSFSEMEADLSEHGLQKFGEQARDQAIFALWTMRKINRLVSKIAESKLSPEFISRDKEIAVEFGFYAFWAQFHLECLLAAMRFNRPIRPEVLDVICDGMRGVVNAYGLLRQGIDLRWPSNEDQLVIMPCEWDEEEQELLDSSMADLEVMEAEEY